MRASMSLNRTNVELKPLRENEQFTLKFRLNRTNVELKLNC